jgi:hypothetical protein
MKLNYVEYKKIMFWASPRLDEVQIRERFDLIHWAMLGKEFKLKTVVNLSRDKQRLLRYVLKIKSVKQIRTKYVTCSLRSHDRCLVVFLTKESDTETGCSVCNRYNKI